MARPRGELVKFWVVMSLVAVAAASLCVTTWGALQSNKTSARPIRIDLSSLQTSAGDEAAGLADVHGEDLPAEAYGIGADGELPLTVVTDPSVEQAGDLIGVTDLEAPGGHLVSSGSSAGPRRLDYGFASRSGPGDGSPGASAIEIRKVLRINGVDSGYAHIRVSASSTLSISTDELSRALVANGRSAAATEIGYRSEPGGFVGLVELRRHGFDVRFDARADRITLDF